MEFKNSLGERLGFLQSNNNKKPHTKLGAKLSCATEFYLPETFN